MIQMPWVSFVAPSDCTAVAVRADCTVTVKVRTSRVSPWAPALAKGRCDCPGSGPSHLRPAPTARATATRPMARAMVLARSTPLPRPRFGVWRLGSWAGSGFGGDGFCADCFCREGFVGDGFVGDDFVFDPLSDRAGWAPESAHESEPGHRSGCGYSALR